MTGSEVDLAFKVMCDEVQSDYFPPAEVQIFCDQALQNIFQRELGNFQVNQTITDNLRVFIKSATVVNPVSNLVDISRTSTDVPFYEMIVAVPRMVFIVDGVPRAHRATELKSQDEGAFFGQGDLLAPKYLIRDNKILCKPEGYKCSEVVISYISEAIRIDITDAVTVAPYPDKFIWTVISDMAELAGIPKKSTFDIQANQQQQNLNP